jgi:hypothetical protein
MSTLVISIDMPPGGASEPSGQAYHASVVGLVDRLPDWPALAPAAPSPGPPARPDRANLGAARVWALSTAERAFFTFVASFLSALTLGGAFSITAAGAALFAGASAALSVVTAAIRSLHPPTDNKALDVVTRVGLTLLQAFAAAFLASSAGATHFSDWRAGALAGLAAAFTALKGTLAVQLNGENAANGEPPTPASLIRLGSSSAKKAGLVVSQARA